MKNRFHTLRHIAVGTLICTTLAAAATIVSEFHVRTIESNLRRLEWKTLQESNLREFRIQRSTNQHDWSPIGTVPAAQDGQTSHSYSFDDNRIFKSETATLYYKLVLVDLQGNTTDHHAIASTAGV